MGLYLATIGQPLKSESGQEFLVHSLVFTVPICRFEVLVDETGAMYNAKTKVQSIPNFRPCSDHYHFADMAGSTGLSTFIELIIPYQLHWIVVNDSVDCGNEL